MALWDLPDLLLLRDLYPIPRHRNQPLQHQFAVVPRRTGTSNSKSSNIRNQRTTQELSGCGGGGGEITAKRRRHRGRDRSGRGIASPLARVRPVRRPRWGTWSSRRRQRRRRMSRRSSVRAGCRRRRPSRTAKRRPSPCAKSNPPRGRTAPPPPPMVPSRPSPGGGVGVVGCAGPREKRV